MSGTWSAYICEAAKRYELPERLIRAVMHVESAADMRALSPKGAMGLMQIMPTTWEELRVKQGLGTDPFNPRDNILAGAAYLREMLDRFGPKGFLAAYNAGPQRYQEHLSTGRPLPRETIDYVAKLMPLIKGAVAIPPPQLERLGKRSSADRSQLFAREFARMNDVEWRDKRGFDSVDQTVFAQMRSVAMPPQSDATLSDLTGLEPGPATLRINSYPTPKPAANSLFTHERAVHLDERWISRRSGAGLLCRGMGGGRAGG
ncbi:lytic transglycosylase domain-containing protein [Mesorhizobium sp. Cs1299R1N3]|uniref:lytic transglycosylase domain-containing protein n=1 Tax=Mesorhizobium sp. Cs1299R1N3 TaxID=3015173 RepID=UPI00301E28FF